MALNPIPVIARVAAARAPAGAPRDAPGAPATLRLVLDTGAAGDLLGRGENGDVYRLATDGDPMQFTPGQTLLVQVLRTGPPLEVRLLATLPGESGAPAGHGSDDDPPALRPDQAAILRLAAGPSEAKAQAAHWRQLALTRLRQAGTVAPGHSAMPSDQVDDATLDAEPALLLHPPHVHGWPLQLWLTPRRRGYGGPNRRTRWRQGTRLNLALNLAHCGAIGLQFDVQDVQVGLSITAERSEALPWLREQISAIATRLGKAGLRLMRCHVRQDGGAAAPPAGTPPPALAEHEMPLVLFRAAAETLAVLRAGAG